MNSIQDCANTATVNSYGTRSKYSSPAHRQKASGKRPKTKG